MPGTTVDQQPSPGDQRRRELGRFLRSRRERIAPEAVGLPPGPGRRRTPGLRREELAQLAAVGVTWYTWLEQGRPINASADVLAAVAQALRLDRHERAHLFALADTPDPTAAPATDPLPASVQAILDALEPHPARVIGPRRDILAYNRADAAVMGDYAELPPERRNVLWLLFTEPAWRRMLLDWDRDARHVIAQFRAAMPDHVGEPAWSALIAELTERSPEFAELWSEREISGPEHRIKRYLHPSVGLLRLQSTHFSITEQPQHRVIIYTPADEASRDGLLRLADLPLHAPWGGG